MAWRDWWDHRSFLIIVIAPLALLPLPILITDQKGLCGYMLLLMAVYWCTEALPIGVTGMIPVFLAPLFGILTTSAVCENYLKDNTMMFTGGLIVAIGIEESFLHKRIALKILILIGTAPQWLMLGFMLPTWLLSMWISNTASTAMMLPIMEAVLEELRDTDAHETQDVDQEAFENSAYLAEEGHEVKETNLGDGDMPQPAIENGAIHDDSRDPNKFTSLEIQTASDDVMTRIENDSNRMTISTSTEPQNTSDKEFNDFCKGMTLAVAFSANVGGVATLTGTGPNVIMKGEADRIWQANGAGVESPVTYASWIVIGLPVAAMLFVILWLWLTFYFLGWRAFCCKKKRNPEKEAKAKAYLKKEYTALGNISFAESMSGLMFITLVLLWFFRSPGFINGWADLPIFKEGYIGDAVPAMFIAVMLFAIPRNVPRCGGSEDSGKATSLLTWPAVHKKYPWSIIFLMGGGFALAESCEVSGLSQWIGEKLAFFGKFDLWLCIYIICFITAMLTEITSNSATCTILMPIVAAMAEELGYNPLLLMFPTALSTSLSFMLPVATPPNAVAFSYGRITVLDMVKAGAILNLLCVVPIDVAINTWGFSYFDLDTIPWDTEGGQGNLTSTLPPCIP